MSFNKVIIEKMAYSLPPHIVSSEELEESLTPIYERLNLQVGRLELMTGIKERRFWDNINRLPNPQPKPVLNYLKKEISILMKLIYLSILQFAVTGSNPQPLLMSTI